MNINKVAKSGTLESNDIVIMIAPNSEDRVELKLESIVMKQFGDQIEKVILDTLKGLGVKRCIINAQDKGALDYTIRARVETAVMRAVGEEG